MKIAILASNINDRSGTSVVAMQQAALFKEAGCDVTFFAFFQKSELPEVPVEIFSPPPGLSLPWKLFWIFFFPLLPPPLHLPFIYRWIRRLSEFDAIVAYDDPVQWLGYYAKKRYGVKYIWFLQGILLPEACESIWEKVYSRLQSPLYKRSMANVDLLATETDYIRAILKNQYGMESMVIQNPTYHSLNINSTGNEVRSRYHIHDDPFMLYVDRLEKHKGIEILLDSFNIVREAVPRAKLVIIGMYAHRSYWKRIQRLSNSSVIFIDYVPRSELADFYAASIVFVTCAISEDGFSHTMVEAQAFGKPVVAFDVGAHKEVIRNGETGILVEHVGNAGEFASALITLLTDRDLAGDMGHKAAEWCMSLAEKAAHDFQDLMNKIGDL